MIEINLISQDLKAKPKKRREILSVKTRYFLYAIPFLFSILICLHIFLAIITLAKNSKFQTLNKKWLNLESQRKILENFQKEFALLSQDAKTVQLLLSQRINWAQKLNKLSSLLPSGIWFNEVSSSGKEFILEAAVVSLQKDHMGLITKLIENLKNDPEFSKGLNNLELSSVEHKTLGGYDIDDFTLTATLKTK